METNNGKKSSLVFREEVKWVVLIVLFVVSGLFNYFTTAKQVSMNDYKIGQIEIARADVWKEYAEAYSEQVKLLRVIRDDIIKIKVKLDIK